MLLNIVFLVLINGIHCVISKNITSQTVLKFGPLALSEYSDVGSQEVIYAPIPASYLPNFSFEWTGGIENTGSSSPESCPHVKIMVLVRKWGLPVPNPTGATYPDNTWLNLNETAIGGFRITQSLPNRHDEYIMIFSDEGNTTGEFYISVFIEKPVQSGIEIPNECKYIVQLIIKAYSDLPLDIAVMTSENYFDTLDTNQYENNIFLDRYRNGLLNTDYITSKEGYNISTNKSLKFSWIVQPYSDVGGTLRIKLSFNSSLLSKNDTILLRGCATWNSDTPFTYDTCENGHSLIVNSSQDAYDIWYWPFPKGGLWALDVGIECIEGDCDNTDININLDTNIVQCIDSCHSGTSQGECKIYRTDILFFSACDCRGGWQGIACTDGTNAVPRSKQLLVVLLLTLSNIIFFPCGVLAIMKGFYSESIVYFFVMFFSTFYHACDNDFAASVCIMPYNTLQFSDFLGSISAMWVTLIAICRLPFILESCFHIAGLMAISVGVTDNRFSVFTTLVPVLCGLFILAIRWGRQCKASHTCYPAKRVWLFSFIPGALCAILGFVLFVFVEDPDNYFYVHSMWHVLMGSAVLFLIPKEKKFSSQVDVESEDGSISGTHYNNVNATDSTTFHLELSDDSS
uniref:transmembrane protein 8B-like n=1 Tax=Styela clava TaxID=7725 RepID=UPI00193A7C95|nr:transmembrane protein 8B-like [Styela clava]